MTSDNIVHLSIYLSIQIYINCHIDIYQSINIYIYIYIYIYRERERERVCVCVTLHSYDLIWAVCHFFPQQRWRTHTYSVLGNHWPGEPRDLRKTTSARKFRPAFGATSKTRIFYKYVVFKHSFSFYTNSSQRIHALSSV